MDIATQLRLAGLTVVTGREGIGRTTGVDGIESKITGTGASHEGSSDLNDMVIPARAVGYIERSGRFWYLADGPVEGNVAVIFLAAHRADGITEAQTDALSAVEAVLGDVYGLPGPDGLPDAGDDDLAADPVASTKKGKS